MSHSFYNKAVEHFAALEAALNALDAATGDGDHGTTMLRGLRAASEAEEAPAKAFRRAAGGASGSLFSLLIGALDSALAGAPLQASLATAAEKISQMGQASTGDKTLLDALVPASTSQTPAAAARAGVEATREMAARRGRAKYVEGAGVGYIDAGATSVAELLELYVALEHQL